MTHRLPVSPRASRSVRSPHRAAPHLTSPHLTAPDTRYTRIAPHGTGPHRTAQNRTEPNRTHRLRRLTGLPRNRSSRSSRAPSQSSRAQGDPRPTPLDMSVGRWLTAVPMVCMVSGIIPTTVVWENTFFFRAISHEYSSTVHRAIYR